MVSSEQMVDLLHVNNPQRMWNQHNRLAYSSSMGPLATPAEYVLTKNALELTDAVAMGMQAMAGTVHTTSNLYSSTTLVVTMLVLSGDDTIAPKDASTRLFGKGASKVSPELQQAKNMKLTKVTFVEMRGLDFPQQCPVEVDRLAGVSPQYLAAKNIMLEGGSQHNGGDENPYISSIFKAHHRKSVLNYMLQDNLYKHPDALIITCLRGAPHTHHDDGRSLDAAVELAEHYDREATGRTSRLLVDVIDELNAEIRECERTASVDLWREREAARLNDAHKHHSKASNEPPKDVSAGLPRRNRDTKPLSEYSEIQREEGLIQRNKATHLRKLIQGFELIMMKDKASAVKVTALFNNTMPFVSSFDLSMSTSTRGMVLDWEYIDEPENKVPYTEVLRAWLKERGIYVKPEKIKLSAGAFDGMFEDDDEESPEQTKKDEFRENTKGVAHGHPWSYAIENMNPYAVLLTPNSGLSEYYGKMPLEKGTTVIRGRTGNYFMTENQSSGIYQSTPIENDCEKDVLSYRNSLRDLCGDGLVPQSALDVLEAEIKAEEDEKSGENLLDTEEGYELPENQEKEVEGKAKELVNIVYCPGPGVLPLHAIIRAESAQFVYIRNNLMLSINGKKVRPELFVNGKPVDQEIPLQDMDIVQLGYGRYLLIRIPLKAMNMVEKNSMQREERFMELNVWERGMLRAFCISLKQAIVQTESNRRHVSHMSVNRELTAVMKMGLRTPLHRIESYIAPEDLVHSVYIAMAPNDRAYLCNLLAASSLINYYASSMRRYMTTRFDLQVAAKSDQEQRGRIVLLDLSAIAASAAAHATASHGKKPKKEVEKDEFGDPISDDEEEEVPESVSNPKGRRKGIRQTNSNNAGEATSEDRLFSASLYCENTGDTPGKFLWNAPLIQERLVLMSGMDYNYHSPWCARDTAWIDSLYPPECDPFNENQDDELIGVGYLYLDSLQYLVDTDDLVPIVSLQGHKCGAIKVKGRVWIDKIETAPPYLTVDEEKTLKNFENKNCVMRLHFESMMDLPPNHCSNTYVRFNFFYHNKPYSTARHGGQSVHPTLHSPIRVDQRITGDFLDYVARGSLELEVYGKRKPTSERKPTIGATIKNNYLTGENLPEIVRNTDEDGDDMDEDENEAQQEEQTNWEEKIQELTINLQKSQNSVNANKKIIDNLAGEKTKLEEKLKRADVRFQELDDSLPAKFKSVKKGGKDVAPSSDGCTVS